MYTDGVLEVHDNVTFEANTAVQDGGAVSLPIEIGFHPFSFSFSRVGLIGCSS